MSTVRLSLVAALCSVLMLAVLAPTAEARKGRGVPRVSSVGMAAQDWYHARIKVKWRRVAGARYYQMRWSYSRYRLARTRPIATRTPYGTYTGRLNRAGKYYFQVRAIKNRRAGSWSRPRMLHFTNRWPRIPTLSGSGQPGAVTFNWPYTPYASRYRVAWSPAPFGKWPGSATYIDRTPGGWVSQYARSSTFSVPTTPKFGDGMLAVPYANPVYAQIEANNAYRAGASMRSGWVPAFPTPPNPGTGDPLRMGTYNVELTPTDGPTIQALKANIAGHHLDVVALQEASSGTASRLVGQLGSAWSAANSGDGSNRQILYRKDRYALLSSGKFDVPNPKVPSDPISTPWARLRPLNPADSNHSQAFFVVSVHFTENAAHSALTKKRKAGESAQVVMDEVNRVDTAGEPVLVAGDMRYLREPFGDVAGYLEAPPTFVRGGYYDAMAALRKTGYQYATVNGHSSHQPRSAAGVASRSDYIMLKGFKGSNAFTNVFNWSYGGRVPSDHNLVYADVTVPFSS